MLLKSNPVDLTAVRVPKAEFDGVVADMATNAGALLPTLNWLTADSSAPAAAGNANDLRAAYTEENFDSKYADMGPLMDAWVGSVGMEALTDQARQRYAPLLASFDPLGLWTANVKDNAVAKTLVNADLGSILDLDLLYAFASAPDRERTVILEVGPGYGRLAEAAWNVFGDSIRFVMIDSVPASICYTQAYLAQACPQLRLGSDHHGDPFDLEQFQAYIAPAWHFERINTQVYDVCVNIESFQEMSQDHVDHYLRLFDSVTADGALIYSSNSHDYAFKGEWRYPKHWRRVLTTNTPRSWTADHPTEIFVKGAQDFSLANEAIDRFHRLGLRVDRTRPSFRLQAARLQRLRARLPGLRP